MPYADELTEIETRLKAGIPITTIPANYIQLPSTKKFTQPAPQKSWLRLTVLNGASMQTTIGSPTNNHRMPGRIIVSVFTPLEGGVLPALQLADTVAGVFRNWSGTNVRCREASVIQVGRSSGWEQVNVSVPFKRDELF